LGHFIKQNFRRNELPLQVFMATRVDHTHAACAKALHNLILSAYYRSRLKAY
jgi:hypothetical protein